VHGLAADAAIWVLAGRGEAHLDRSRLGVEQHAAGTTGRHRATVLVGRRPPVDDDGTGLEVDAYGQPDLVLQAGVRVGADRVRGDRLRDAERAERRDAQLVHR